MKKHISFFWIFLAVLFVSRVGATLVPIGKEHLIICGGPALRFFERGKANSHDKFWGNFIEAARARTRQFEGALSSGDRITWLVYRPGYVTRAREMGEDLLKQIVTEANQQNVSLLWFDKTEQLVNYLNKGKDRRVMPIASLDYFGHSNKACLLFDYSCDLDGMSRAWLHERDLSKLESSIFAKGAFVKSWGCHSGESYSQAWQRRFLFPMIGAVGKTDYKDRGLPVLASAQGRWVP